MSKTTMKLDLEWTVRLLNEFTLYLKQDQKMMARGTIQKIRQTLETYGRIGNEMLFEKILDIEENIGKGERSLLMAEELKKEIQSVLSKF